MIPGRIAFFGTILYLTACTYVSDGVYVQKRGYLITSSQLNQLSAGRTTYEEAVRVLGFPAERKLVGGGELAIYISVRTRRSTEHSFVGHDRATDTAITNTVTLYFVDGILNSIDEEQSIE
jgi:outer membrane protein assembly factor BamE (lipoprotein component of BamABCDE complex)